jgi:anti-sigma B factor antagonist
VRIFKFFWRKRSAPPVECDEVEMADRAWEAAAEGLPVTVRQLSTARTQNQLSTKFDVASEIQASTGRALVRVYGAIDVYTAPRFREHLIELVAAGGWDTMVIDLRNVTFLDSSALGVLTGAKKRLMYNEKDVVLVMTSSPLLRVFELTGLTNVFVIIDDPDVLD